jgi:hypothetical protein
MDYTSLDLMMKRRHLELWAAIVKNYEVEASLNTQVQNWIRCGVFSEKAYDVLQRRKVKKSSSE